RDWSHVLLQPSEEPVVGAGDREKPRGAVIERDRGETIVEQRMIEVLASHAARDERAETGRHRDAVSTVTAGVKRAVEKAGVRHLIARESDVSTPRVIDPRSGKRRKDRGHVVAQDPGAAGGRVC